MHGLRLLEFVRVLLVEPADVGRLHADLRPDFLLQHLRDEHLGSGFFPELRGGHLLSGQRLREGGLGGELLPHLLHRFVHLGVGGDHVTPCDLLLQQAHGDELFEHAAVHLISLVGRHGPSRPLLHASDRGLELGALDLVAVHFCDHRRQFGWHRLWRRRCRWNLRGRRCGRGSGCGGAGLRGGWLRGRGRLRGGGLLARHAGRQGDRETDVGLLHRNLKQHTQRRLLERAPRIGCAVEKTRSGCRAGYVAREVTAPRNRRPARCWSRSRLRRGLRPTPRRIHRCCRCGRSASRGSAPSDRAARGD